MSIKPEYAHAIFRGEKHFEFRRSIFRQPVDVIVVYMTNPVGMVFGEFEVRTIIRDTVGALWNRTKSVAGIDKERFFKYFKGRAHGYAIQVGDIRTYQEPLRLDEHFGVKPPQSFLYLDDASSNRRHQPGGQARQAQ